MTHIGAFAWLPRAGMGISPARFRGRSQPSSAAVLYPLISVLLAFAYWIIPAISQGASYNERPWWAERSTFVEGDTLYAVGVASHAKTVEDGRQQAFERGAMELTNFSQITSLEAQGLVIETQMTFEESNSDGTVNIYRLLRVPIAKLLSVQSQLRSKSSATEQQLHEGRRELEMKRAALRQKEQEAETLLQQLRSQLGEQEAKSSQGTPVVQRLKEASIQVEKRAEDTEVVIQSAQQRIAMGNEERKAMCARLIKGMTKAEVAAVLGEPTARDHIHALYYGREKRISIAFDNYTGEAKFIYGCAFHELADEIEKAQQRAEKVEKQARKEAEWARDKRARERKEEEILRKTRAEEEKREQDNTDRAVKFINCSLDQMGKSEEQRQECPEP